jgi:hypothetical protein
MVADQPFTVRELGTRESLRLLHQLAPGVIDEEGALDLVRAVGGLPLALTLMGNYLRKQSYRRKKRCITTALERLNSAEERLYLSQSHELVERHPSLSLSEPLSLQSVIAVGDQQLAEPVRQTFYALSVFLPKPNSFSERAALADDASHSSPALLKVSPDSILAADALA